VKIPLSVQLLEPPYHLAQIFGGFGQGEHHARKQSLLIDEIATVAVLKHHIVVIVVFQEIMQFGHVLMVHLLHALHLPLQILNHFFVVAL
jgi:hypothetical protein